MKERPILFKGEMIQAILDGRKRETRRKIKPQPPPETVGYTFVISTDQKRNRAFVPLDRDRDPTGYPTRHGECGPPVRCPFGAPGDVLWCRETWSVDQQFDLWKPRDIPLEEPRDGMKPAPQFVWYAADTRPTDYSEGKNRPSIFMPRWASRITLNVLELRAERLQDITTEGIVAEGFSTKLREHDAERDLRDQFKAAWEAMHGAGAWEKDDYVWVVTFEEWKCPF